MWLVLYFFVGYMGEGIYSPCHSEQHFFSSATAAFHKNTNLSRNNLIIYSESGILNLNQTFDVIIVGTPLGMTCLQLQQ